MAKRADRALVGLSCADCKERNYWTEKNKKNDPGRLELKKYCPRCRSTKLHREVR
jgi:large subunit ribosomal protein L33